RGGDPRRRRPTLTLRELEALSRSRLPVFLAFLHARIAREESFLLQNTAQLGAELDQRACDTMLHCAGLSMHSPTFNSNVNIEFIQGVGSFQQPFHEHAVE